MGALWMTAQAASFSAMVAAVRYLSPHYSAFEIVFFRSVIGLALQAPWAIGGGWRTVLDARWRLVMVRSLFNFAGAWVWFTALGLMAISDAVGGWKRAPGVGDAAASEFRAARRVGTNESAQGGNGHHGTE